MGRVRNAWLKALQDLGASPRFVPVHVLAAERPLPDVRVLVLPTVRALADAEAAGIDRFLAQAAASKHPPPKK